MPTDPRAGADADAFYHRVLGLEPVPTPDGPRGLRRYQGPCVTLDLDGEDPFHPARTAHPTLLVDDLDALVQRIRRHRGRYLWADHRPGGRRVRTDDPFGNLVELVEAEGPTPATFKIMAERAIYPTVEAMAAGAGLGEMLAGIVTTIEAMLPDTTVAVGDRWTGGHFELSAGSATALLAPQPGAPWAVALSNEADHWVDDLGELPRPLAALARAEGFASCWVHPVAPALAVHPTAAIVIWTRSPGPPTPYAWNTVRRAGQLLSLALQWARSHAGLEYAATHDPLTGLVNRQAFRDRLATVAGHRPGPTDAGYDPRPDRPMDAVILYVDLDRFKPVNDRLGHLAGDRVLAVLAGRFRSALRPGDLVARMGGDEFAILCERLRSRDDAGVVAERLLDVIRTPMSGPGEAEIRLDASVGLVEVRGHKTVDVLLDQADEAMRAAKSTGPGRWQWYRE